MTTGHGPDDYEYDCPCQLCGGNGSLFRAFEGMKAERDALSSHHEDGGRAATDKESARDAAFEQAANLVECEYAADATQGRRLAQIAQHIRDLKKRNQS